MTTTLGTFTDKNTLARIRPANPASLALNVFNASTQSRMAKTLSDELRSIGFNNIGAVADDPLYPNSDLRCVGEIRYGLAGSAGAFTALLIMPCAQLVVDDRLDDSVDVAIGALFAFQPVPEQVRTQLSEIATAWIPPAVIEGQTAAARSTPQIPPLPVADCPGASS